MAKEEVYVCECCGFSAEKPTDCACWDVYEDIDDLDRDYVPYAWEELPCVKITSSKFLTEVKFSKRDGRSSEVRGLQGLRKEAKRRYAKASRQEAKQEAHIYMSYI